MEFATPLVIGFLGSLHCIGMCGPIALSLPFSQVSKGKFIYGRILYNFGRIITYSVLGFLFGLMGNRIHLWGIQSMLSIVIGVVIILSTILPQRVNLFNNFTSILKKPFGILFKRNNTISLLQIGILNGFLPCGFVYMGLALAITTKNPLDGMLSMMMFGLGTFPAMLALSFFGKFLSENLRAKVNKIIPVLAIILGVLFIIRGLGLGIPFLSPVEGMHHN